jgi:hypothetical protein
MNTRSFDIFVAKDFETIQNGTPEKRTIWNKVGRAWPSKSAESLSFELYLLPNLRYVIQLKERKPERPVEKDEVPF